MSTEYRRGIPSIAHVEAATRLGLLWQTRSGTGYRRRDPAPTAQPTEQNRSYRPIRPDGTSVDWDVLDQEVARVGQRGQPQGFRADLWRRICRHFIGADEDRVSSRHLSDVETVERRGCLFRDDDGWQWLEDEGPTRADILARWAVYQELKPLYDLVDGAQGEAAMPRDVEVAWYSASVNERRRAVGSWILARDASGLLIKNNRNTVNWRKDEPSLGAPLRNFVAVLDAVAERRVAERMRGQPQAPTVTSAQPEPRRFADVRPDRHGWRWWRMWGSGCILTGSSIECQPDLGWRIKSNGMYTFDWNVPNSSDSDRTVIPTDEQGNPVSWEAAGFAAEAVRGAQESVQRAANDATPARSVGDIEWTATGQPVTRDMTVEPATGVVRSTHTTRIRQLDRLVTEAIQAGNQAGFSTESPTPPRPGQFSNNPATPPLTPEGFQRVLVGAVIGVDTAKAPPITTLPPPLPRFTDDELDDVDHSKTTKLDEATLRRGKLPTVEQIAKYREVRARRTGGAVADALKESRIDCEVAQYVLERWAGGLGDELALWLLRAVGKYSRSDLRFTQRSVDELARRELIHEAGAIETAEPSPTVQRERQEAEERRQRLAELRQRLAAERAAQPQEMAKESDTVSRFDLIEPDPQADPAASIRAWEARQAAAKVRPTATPPRIAKPAAAPRRPAIEVVDAEVDGLSRSEAFAALFGRALNGGC